MIDLNSAAVREELTEGSAGHFLSFLTRAFSAPAPVWPEEAALRLLLRRVSAMWRVCVPVAPCMRLPRDGRRPVAWARLALSSSLCSLRFSLPLSLLIFRLDESAAAHSRL